MSAITDKLTDLAFKSAEWNQRKLPDNTLNMQLAKIEEEILECKEAFEAGDMEKMEWEIADVFITIGGLIRFDKRLYLETLIDFADGIPMSFERLAELVEKKLEIIEEIPYEIINGVYRHPTIN